MHAQTLRKIDNRKLIVLVREHPYLYDINDCRYSDNEHKDAAWKDIAKNLKAQEVHCKKAWALLRDSFRRAMRKQKDAAMGLNPAPRRWKFEQEMSFLLPHIKGRRSNATVQAKHETEDNDDNFSDTHSRERSATPEFIALQALHSKRAPQSTNADPISEDVQNYVIQKRHKIEPTTRYSEEPTSNSLNIMLQNEAKTNDIQQFFASISTTVQTFPSRDRAIAKARVFSVISEMELEILGRNSSSVSIETSTSYDGHMSEGRSDFHGAS